MSAWQARFAQALRSTLTGAAGGPSKRLAFVQAAVQPSKFIVLPIALLVTAPFGAAFAFYQNLTAISYADGGGIRRACAAAWRQANLRAMQNWILLGITGLLAAGVFANVAVALLIAPQLLKSFLGIETPLTQGEASPLNSTFIAIALALTYAIVDPLVKAIYTLRCFYGESLATGEDLKAQLKAVAAAVAVAAALLVCAGRASYAQTPERQQTTSAQPAVAGDLNRSIDNVLQRSEFSWRLPRRAHVAEKKNWFTSLISSWSDALGRWLDRLIDWLNERARSDRGARAPARKAPELRTWFYILIGAAMLISLALLVHSFRRGKRKTMEAEAIAAAAPDLSSEETSADQLPADEWLRAAREYASRNDFRLAVRALYLASLAQLGALSLIAIGRGKTNQQYARELRRRARSNPAILQAFAETAGIFERSWYGLYDVDAGAVLRVEENLAAMRPRVEQ
jgi:hypothetical protein